MIQKNFIILLCFFFLLKISPKYVISKSFQVLLKVFGIKKINYIF
jgi:hypothetical protein